MSEAPLATKLRVVGLMAYSAALAQGAMHDQAMQAAVDAIIAALPKCGRKAKAA